jgi:hypothetical protein
MGNALSDFDKQKKEKAKNQLSDWLNERGVPLPSEDLESVPDFSDNAEAVNWWFVAQTSGISHKKQAKWMKDKFSIGARAPLSFYERKRKSVLSADNPFPTTQSEAENMILDKIEQHLPFRRGGQVRRHQHFFHTRHQRKF